VRGPNPSARMIAAAGELAPAIEGFF